MDIPELYFKIIFKIIKAQNEHLLHEISVHENISLIELKNKYLPKMRDFKEFITTQTHLVTSPLLPSVPSVPSPSVPSVPSPSVPSSS